MTIKRVLTVKRASFHEHETGTQFMCALLAEDDNHRHWRMGTPIRTSAIIKRQGTMVETLNTIYQVVD